MSDSEEDLFPNVYTFQNENTIISARGPGSNKSNITGLSFRSNVLTSTLNMPGNAPRLYGPPQYERNLYNVRETSPMSMRSDVGPRNINSSYYPRAMSSQRSLVNGRSGSPVSVRSTDSTVSAVDIANAFKYMNFNNHELRIIKDAYNKLMRNRSRKRIEKRRNLKLFLRGVRRKSGYDSGEQGSDSSISSDDCPSVKTTTSYKSNVLRHQINKIGSSSLRTSIKETDIYTDCTDSIKLNTLRNVLPVPPKNIIKNQCKLPQNGIILQQNELESNNDTSQKSMNNTMTLKDRFTKGFLLPSQRFNKSKSNVSSEKLHTNMAPQNNINFNNDSEDEQIFPEITRTNGISNPDMQRKRCLDDDNNNAETKRSKLDINAIATHGKSTDENNSDFDNDDFTFKKPSMPIRKSGKGKQEVVKEVLISKSAQALAPDCNNRLDGCTQASQANEIENNQTVTLQNTTDVSMRPSFIKRKLFTQKLDHLDSKNLSSDNLAAPSPQTKCNANKEKNKTRKLVTSQSCLSRDVQDDENNVLHLISKIIPADQMNLTTATNKRTNKSSNVTDDKWDVTSVVSMCNSAEGSDTFTDEEILSVQNTVKKAVTKNKIETDTKKSEPCPPIVKNCKVVLENVTMANVNKNSETLLPAKISNERTVSIAVRSFWDTDLESDLEGDSVPAWKVTASVNQVKEPVKDVTDNANLIKPKRKNASISTVRGAQNKINNKTILNETKPPTKTLKSPPKTDLPVKKINNASNKTTKVTQKKINKEIKSCENTLNRSTRSTRNSKKSLDCSCCDNTSNGSNNNKQTEKTKPKVNAKTAPLKETKKTPNTKKVTKETTPRGRKRKDVQSILNNTQESESSFNISSKSLRSSKRLENSKENISPDGTKRTRGWCKNTSTNLQKYQSVC